MNQIPARAGAAPLRRLGGLACRIMSAPLLLRILLRFSLASLVPVLLTACSGPSEQSILEPTGIQATRIGGLWWLFFWVCTAVYVLVLLFVGIAIAAARRRKLATGNLSVTPTTHSQELHLWRWVTGAIVATVVILFVLLVSDFLTHRAVSSLSRAEGALKVRVTGRQWWWEIRYEDQLTSNVFTTANELHIPVGRPVHLELVSNDVIHSFWIPNLHGKKDLVPGHPTQTWLQADKPGMYRGQCAEFCGHQHAKMRFTVTAETPAEFEAWLAASRQQGKTPETESQKKGQQVFLSSACVMCHTIQGTPARATVGPDLTHLASRPTLAAGSLPNNRGNLAAWILDPQHIKPGVRMPQNTFPPDQFHALLDYLESLK